MQRRRAGYRAVGLLAIALLAGGCAQGPRADAPGAAAPAPVSVDALAAALGRAPVVLLGEVHDNAAQHAVRARALARLLAGGARPAIAFEQIDRDRQALVDRIRADSAEDAARRADRIVADAGARGWDWTLYRPYVLLALQYDLPIVAANLSRAQAMRVATDGIDAVFDPPQRAVLGLDDIAPDLQRAQDYEITLGHCGQLPAAAVPALAQAQIARDAVLAQSITPYLERGVVLLTGNGHARRDIGVPRHLAAGQQRRLVAIGLLEDDGKAADRAGFFDVAFLTPVQARADPCGSFRHGSPPLPGGAAGMR